MKPELRPERWQERWREPGPERDDGGVPGPSEQPRLQLVEPPVGEGADPLPTTTLLASTLAQWNALPG